MMYFIDNRKQELLTIDSDLGACCSRDVTDLGPGPMPGDLEFM